MVPLCGSRAVCPEAHHGGAVQMAGFDDVQRDNTGRCSFEEGRVLPAVDFPSDHAIVSATLRFRSNPLRSQANTAWAEESEAQVMWHGDKEDKGEPRLQDDIQPASLRPADTNLEWHDGTSTINALSVLEPFSQNLTTKTDRELRGGADAPRTDDACKSRAKTKTLYDYWGICDKPAASAGWADPVFSLRGPSNDGDVDDNQSVHMDGVLCTCGTGEIQKAKCSDGAFVQAGDGDCLATLCEQFFVRFSGKEPGRDLDDNKKLLCRSNGRTIWALFSSRPASIICCMFWFQATLIAVACAYLIDAGLHIHAAIGDRRIQATAFRFTVLARRDGQNLSAFVGSAGLLQHGCGLAAKHDVGEVSQGIPSVTLSFLSDTEVDGWFVVTSNQPSEKDPVRYRWESFDNITSSWQELSYPRWITPRAVEGLPTCRETAKVLDLRPPLLWLAIYCAYRVFAAVAYVVAVSFGAKKQGNKAVGLISSTCAVYASLYFAEIVNVLQNLEGNGPLLVFVYFLYMLCAGLMGLALLSERYMVDQFFISMGLLFVARAVDISLHFYRADLLLLSYLTFVFNPGLLFLASLAMVIIRSKTRAWVFGEFVVQDRKSFDSIWEKLQNSSDRTEPFLKLKKLLDTRFSCQTPNPDSQRPVRQRHRFQTESRIHPIRSLQFFRKNKMQPLVRPLVDSLDQLYVQAYCVDFFLRDKIRSLATSSNGYFVVNSSAEVQQNRNLMKWTDLGNGALSKVEFEATVRWAQLKGPERCFEKLIRCYDGDVSRLLDCCRQSIYFDCVQDLMSCLHLIASDSQINVVRIKNRLIPGTRAEWSGGFRNVVLNLNIICTETIRLGVEAHIVELQLTLNSFAEIMNDQSHERYLVLRNCRDSPNLLDFLKDSFRLFGKTLQTKFRYCWNRGTTVAPNPELGDSQLEDVVVKQTCPSRCLSRKQSGFLHSRFCTSSEAKRYVMEEQLVAATTFTRRHHGSKRGRDLILQEAVAQAASGCVWDTSNPFAASLCKPWIPSFLFFGVVMQLLGICLSSWTIINDGIVHGQHFRFTALQLRDGRGLESISNPGIQALGVADVRTTAQATDEGFGKQVIGNSTLTLSFPKPVPMNFWWFETTVADVNNDPVRFYIERSVDAVGTAWEKVGSSTAVWTWTGSQVWTDGPYDTTLRRSVRVSFKTGVPWAWSVFRLASLLSYLWLCALLLFASLSHRQMYGSRITSVFTFLGHLIHFAQFAVCLAFDQRPLAAIAAFTSVLELITSAIFAFREPFVRHWYAIAGMGFSGSVVLHHAVHIGQPVGLLNTAFGANNQGFWEGISMVGISVAANYLRYRSLARSVSIVAQDWKEYDKCWVVLLLQDADYGVLDRLARRAAELANNLPREVRQRSRALAESNRDLSLTFKNEKLEPVGSLVMDLDQLLAQAAMVDLFLVDKVKQWALISEGLVSVSAEGNLRKFERWSEVVADETRKARVEWASLKTMRRATEKLYRSYNCDVSRLLDLCRQSIYFENLEGLLACLDAVAADPDVRLSRVVNKLRIDYNAADTVGYRDILVNLRIETSETRRLRVETHICELQLVLVNFALIKTNDGHARYVMWRNQRGT